MLHVWIDMFYGSNEFRSVFEDRGALLLAG